MMQTLVDFKRNLHGQSDAPRSGISRVSNAEQQSVVATNSTATNNSTGAGGPNSTTITANDFLQLLVAEMKNQDPTANQDPNAYIDQLVQVNSLQQLISINQDLTPTSAASSGSAYTSAVRNVAALEELGTASGSPAASVANSLSPRAAQPIPVSTSTKPANEFLFLPTEGRPKIAIDNNNATPPALAH